MGVDEDEYAGGSSTDGGITGATGANEDKYASSSYSASGGSGGASGAGAAGIDKNEDVGNGFAIAVAGGVGGSVEKQLKVSKSKILVAIINCKKSHLPKKTMAIKLSQALSTAS